MKNNLAFWFKGNPISSVAIMFYKNGWVRNEVLDIIHGSKRGWPSKITLSIK